MWQNTTGKAIWRTTDDRLVDEGDEDAAFLLVGIDGSIPLSDAEKYGLTNGRSEKAKADAPQNKAKEPPDDPKAKRKT